MLALDYLHLLVSQSGIVLPHIVSELVCVANNIDTIG